MIASALRMPAIAVDALRDLLERVYARYNHRQFIGSDPLQFVYRYSNRRDREIVGFLASVLAYGRVRQIERSLTELFDRMDNVPYEFISNFDTRARPRLRGFKHRFTTGDDLSELFVLLRRALEDFVSLEGLFVRGYRREHADVLPALKAFCDWFFRTYADLRGPAQTPPPGLRFLLANPSRGSACKRLNLFLRWMVRKDEVDPGLWKFVDKAKLIVPVDVHMGRLCRILGLHDSKTASLATAVKITAGFAAIEPADPVKYDFSLSRIGILEDCTGRRHARCESCELNDICRARCG